MPLYTLRLLTLFTTLLLAVGCSPKQSPAKADFRATDTGGRVPAIVNAAGNDDPAELEELVHALSDADPAVRLFAIQALQTRTGQTLGYRYYGSEDERRDAVARWGTWLDDQDLASEPIITGYDALPTTDD